MQRLKKSRPVFTGINGLKGFAILLIVAYHCFTSVVPLGFIGVEVFLVIAGFLTATSVLYAYANETFSYWGYIRKRCMRLWPTMSFVALISTCIVGLLNVDFLVHIRERLAAALTFTYNWYAVLSNMSYFDDISTEFLRHYWFVGLLIQCYILLPLLLIAVMKYFSHYTSIFVGLACTSAGIMTVQYALTHNETIVYFSPYSHSFGILLGMALATFVYDRQSVSNNLPEALQSPYRIPRISRPIASFGGMAIFVAMIAFSCVVHNSAAAFYGGLFVVAIATVMLLAFLYYQQESWLSICCKNQILAVIGEYSLEVYLWHYPVLAMLRTVFYQFNINTPVMQGIIGMLVLAVSIVVSFYTRVVIRAITAMVNRFLSSGNTVSPLSRYTIVVGVVGVVIIAAAFSVDVYHLVHAPSKTQLELQIEASEKFLQQEQTPHNHAKQHQQKLDHAHNGKESTSAPVTKTDTNAHSSRVHSKKDVTMPTGAQITAIGDSVMLASQESLLTTFPGISVDAAVSRSMFAGIDTMQNLRNTGTLRPWVILGLSTNGTVTEKQLQQAYNLLPAHGVLVLVNAHGERSWIPTNNALYQSFAQQHTNNVVLVDWDNDIAGCPQCLYADGIHPNPEGRPRFSQGIYDAIHHWLQEQAEHNKVHKNHKH